MKNQLVMMIICYMVVQLCNFCLFKNFLTFNQMETILNIASYNCQGAKFRNYDYIKDTFNKCDILLLQETWMYNFEHSQFINFLPNCQYTAVSAMDDVDIHRSGRPKGGCAVLWRRDLAISFMPVHTNSKRICAVHAKSEHINCMIISVYMPIDDNTNVSFNFYGDTLYELSSLVSLYDDCDFIIGGDFNVDFSRKNSRNLGLFKVFVNDEDFICPSLHHLNKNYTREDNLGNRSFIDHFLVSKNVINSNFSVAYDGCNLSDHNPISISTMYNNKSTYSSNSCSYKILDWGKASDANIQSYKMLLNHYLIILKYLNRY